MLKNIKVNLKHCEICEKNTHNTPLSKYIIFYADIKPLKQWAINVIGTIPKNNWGKIFNITAINFCIDGNWQLAIGNNYLFSQW